MPLLPFSATVDDRFRIKLAFDTNLLMYLLDNSYPKLNNAIIELDQIRSFVDLITNPYALFELHEKRKETHFIDFAWRAGFKVSRTNSDRFNIPVDDKICRVIKKYVPKKIFGYNLQEKILKNISPKADLFGDGLYFLNQPAIRRLTLSDIQKIQNDFGIEIIGSIHDNIWNPTSELMLHSRISREDSLVAMSFLFPELFRMEKNLIILTNDGDFQAFYQHALNKGLISPLFASLGINEPVIQRISQMQTMDGSIFNLKTVLPMPLREKIIEFVKGSIRRFNSSLFLGYTDGKILPRNIQMIGLKIKGPAEYNSNQNLLIIGKNLDFIYTIPYSISEFRDSKENKIDFPLRVTHMRVCFKHIALDPSDPDKAYENQILQELKKDGNLVFVHPDSI